jgi:2-dehydro-3-deoxygluconokinase
VVTFGETMALMGANESGPLQHNAAMTLRVGGAESNVAIALARLGTPVTWLGRVGADSLGELVLRELRSEGVDVRGIRDADAATGLMVKERRTAEQTNVWYYRAGSAGSRLHPADIDEAVVSAASLLHVTGITPALSPSAADATFEAIRIARAAGVAVSFDLNFRSRLWSAERAKEVYLRIIPEADIVFAGDDEAAIVVGSAAHPLELAQRLIDCGAGAAIVKLGERGAVAIVDGEQYERTAITVTPIDTVGAGDGFVAGYLAEHLRELDVSTRLTTAVRVGAYACQVPGDWEGMPTRAELARLSHGEPVSR